MSHERIGSMALIRRNTDHGVRALLHLAQSPGATVACDELARACQIPKGFSYKTLRKLVEAGILQSTPGRTGGFGLVRPPADISMLDVVNAIQGHPVVSECVHDVHACNRRPGCVLAGEWCRFQRQLDRLLEQTTLQDVLQRSAAGEVSCRGVR